MTNPALLAALFFGVLLGLSLGALWFLVHRHVTTSDRKRHDHPTLHGLFDANAVSVDGWLDAIAELERQKNRFEQVTRILGEVSEGPHSYQDSPSSKDQLSDSAKQQMAQWLYELASKFEVEE